MGWISLIPVALAIVLAFVTKNTVFSLLIACVAGAFLSGGGLFGFTDTVYSALGNMDFVWAAMCVLPFGIMVAYFKKSGAIEGFTDVMNKKNLSRKGVGFMSWFLGILCFADSLSPLFVGTTMRSLSDRSKISHEKLAYVADATAACVGVTLPYTSWTPYLASLAVGIGAISSQAEGQKLALMAIPLNFYSLLTILMVLFLAIGLLKDFGPMKKAEKRALEEGKLDRDGAEPLISPELANMQKSESLKTRIWINFIGPILLLVAFCLITLFVLGEVMIVESACAVVALMSISFLCQGMKLKELGETFIDGIKGIVPALLILALAYVLKAFGDKMGTANFIINCTQGFLTPQLLPLVIFIVAAIISFATGTSWGTYAICLPLALPLAFNATGGEINTLVVACFAAVAGGGVFGDHCSPLSDTTIMSSMGAACDHVDHVKTQLPYALVTAAISAVAYLVIGFCVA